MKNKANIDLKVEYIPIGRVRPSPDNPRHHSASQIAMLAASMSEHGNVNPVLVDEKDVLIAGHGRLEAAKLIGLDKVPAIRLRHLKEAQKRLYRIADNQLSLLSSWDASALVAEFARIELEAPERTCS